MKPIPVTNFRSTWNGGAYAGSKLVVRKFALGQMGPSIGQAELDYRRAVAVLDGVNKAHSSMASLIGKKEADQVLEQARKVVEETQVEYVKEIPQK